MQQNTWRAFWQALTRFERAKIHPLVAVRNAVGVILPLVIADAIGQHSLGLVGSLGALNVAYSDGEDAYGLRARRMLAASGFVALALFLGGLTGQYQILAILLAMAWAFSAGLLIALGTTAGDIGTVSLVTLVVFASRPLSPRQAAISGVVALGGSLLQTGLSLLFWPIRRYTQEQSAVAAVYRELACLPAREMQKGLPPLAAAELTQAQVVLAALNVDRDVEAEKIQSLLSQGERIRLRQLTLVRLRKRLERDAVGRQASELIARFLDSISEPLRKIATALDGDNAARRGPSELAAASAALAELREFVPPHRTPFADAMIRDAIYQMDAAAGQVRAALRLAAGLGTSIAGSASTLDGSVNGSRRVWRSRWQTRLGVLSANLTFRSVAFRHAVRLAVCVGLGDAIGRVVDWQRSYWIPMTIAIVLKPDFLTTVSRGALRLAGTFAGLILTTILYRLLPTAALTDIVFVGVFTLVMRWIGPANYGIFVVAVSGLVVALIANTGVAPHEVIPLRALNTAVGGVLALVAYAVWPTWERTQSGESFARLLDRYRDYLQAVRGAVIEGTDSDFAAADRTRQAARVARSNVEASVERLTIEPGTELKLMRLVAAMLASSHDFIYAVMTLETGGAHRARSASSTASGDARRRFFDEVDLTLYFLAATIRGSRLDLKQLPDLRAEHTLLFGNGTENETRHSLLEVETDRMVNALNTLSEQICEWRKTFH